MYGAKNAWQMKPNCMANDNLIEWANNLCHIAFNEPIKEQGFI